MSQRVKAKTPSKAHQHPAVRRPIVQAAAHPGSAEFEGLLDGLVAYLNWRSEDPLKDAEALDKILDEIRAAKRRTVARRGGSSSGPRGSRKAPSVPMKEPKMGKVAPRSKSNAFLMAERRPTSPKLEALLAAVLDQPEKWMSTPSVQFGGRRPIDLVGTDEEIKIFDVLHAVDQGLF